MGVSMSVVDVAASTSTGDQVITGAGFTPKGYIVMMSRGITDATANNDMTMSYGFCDGTRERAMVNFAEDDVPTTNTIRRMSITHVVNIMDSGGGVEGQAQHVSLDADGITIDWTNSVSVEYRLQVVFLGGDDLEVEVGDEKVQGADGEDWDITLVGTFEPTACLFFTTNSVFNDSTGGRCHANYGGATATGQCNVGVVSRDNQVSTQSNSHAWDTRCYTGYNNEQDIGIDVEFVEFLSDGFRVARHYGDSSSSAAIGYMALRSTTNGIFVGNIESPSSSGEQGTTGIGFKPQAAMIIAQGAEVINTEDSFGGNASIHAIGVFDGVEESCLSTRDEADAATTVASSRWDDGKTLYLEETDDTVVHDATFVSFDSDGFTLDYANAHTAVQWLVFAIEENAATAPYLPFYPERTNTLLRM